MQAHAFLVQQIDGYFTSYLDVQQKILKVSKRFLVQCNTLLIMGVMSDDQEKAAIKRLIDTQDSNKIILHGFVRKRV